MKAGCPRPTAALIRPLTALRPLFRTQPPIQAAGIRLWQRLLKPM